MISIKTSPYINPDPEGNTSDEDIPIPFGTSGPQILDSESLMQPVGEDSGGIDSGLVNDFIDAVNEQKIGGGAGTDPQASGDTN